VHPIGYTVVRRLTVLVWWLRGRICWRWRRTRSPDRGSPFSCTRRPRWTDNQVGYESLCLVANGDSCWSHRRLPSIADRVTSSSSVFFTTASKLATAAVTAGGRSARGQQCLDGYDEGDEAAPKRNIEEGRAIQLGSKRLLFGDELWLFKRCGNLFRLAEAQLKGQGKLAKPLDYGGFIYPDPDLMRKVLPAKVNYKP
jgi:hypothetical protein